jgi:eukaryotic-like serine/threonine-protein kinase
MTRKSAFFILLSAALLGCKSQQPIMEANGVFTSPVDGMVMLYIPAGDFKMGSLKGLTDEQPQHDVYLDAYFIDQTEVTNVMYQNCVEDGDCEAPYSTEYYDDPAYAEHPVSFVSWVNATSYCEWARRRLPTEAEWEKAAIWDAELNEQRIYPWGNEYDCTMGNFDDELTLDASIMPNTPEGCDGFIRSAPVGSFPAGASPYGALDMGGNVWEWVHDAFLEVDPLTTTVTNYYAISPRENPQGVDPSLTDYRVVRGGSWSTLFGFGRGAYRLWYGLDDAYNDIGFRCAVSESP